MIERFKACGWDAEQDRDIVAAPTLSKPPVTKPAK
jgi:hypothetical protein